MVAFAPFIPQRWNNAGEAYMPETLLKSFDKPDEIREFPFGRFEIIHLDGVSLGRATYQLDGNGLSTKLRPSEPTFVTHRIRTLCFQATEQFNMKTASIWICCWVRYFT